MPSLPSTLSSVVIRKLAPSLSTMLPFSTCPVRIFGPAKSASSATPLRTFNEAVRNLSIDSACCWWLPCEKFNLATSIPAVSSSSSLSWLRLLGPSVQTIFALRIQTTQPSTAQQYPKIPLLPLKGGSVVRKGLFAIAKCSRVMNAPAAAVGAGEELVQHLVEDDELDEVGGNLVPVERGMNPDLSGLVVVQSQADRPAALLERHAPPTDLGPDASLKVLVVEAAEDLAQVEAATVRVERRIRIPLLANQRLTTADEIVQDRSGFSLSPSGVVGDRADHRLGRVEEHVVQAQSEIGLQPAKAHHRRAIVGDRKTHGDVQIPGESPRQVSRFE